MTADNHIERIAELEKDNRRLRRLLDQRDAPGELRHRLRSTLALLRSVLRKSAETERDLPSFVAHLEDRLDAIARAQGMADQYGEVDLRVLLADEMLQYGAKEDEALTISGPVIRLQPRAGQIVALALHELAANAVQHGALGSNTGRVDVSWSVTETEGTRALRLVWAEFGAAACLPPASPGAWRGFGTQVLTSVLAYDLQAETTLMGETAGLQCTIQFPLPDRVGRVISPAHWWETGAAENLAVKPRL